MVLLCSQAGLEVVVLLLPLPRLQACVNSPLFCFSSPLFSPSFHSVMSIHSTVPSDPEEQPS